MSKCYLYNHCLQNHHKLSSCSLLLMIDENLLGMAFVGFHFFVQVNLLFLSVFIFDLSSYLQVAHHVDLFVTTFFVLCDKHELHLCF